MSLSARDLAPLAQPVDCLPVSETTWRMLYAYNVRTVARLIQRVQTDPKTFVRFRAAARLSGWPSNRLVSDLICRLAFQEIESRWEKKRGQPLDRWPFDTATRNALEKNGLVTLGDLVAQSPEQLLGFPDLGDQRLAICREWVAANEICFGIR